MVFMPHWPKILGSKPIYYDLSNITELMQRLGNPQNNLPPVIHVAGTNGKGSTIAFLRAIFEAASYKVHTYTSPHLLNFNERIVLSGQEISDDYLTQLMEECRIAAEGMNITFFEGTTAGAFLAFSRHPADVILLETGMGGRLDATNIVKKPIMTIITPISIDHVEYLGPNISTIAREKTGIMKKGVKCISSLQTDAAHLVIEQEAEKIGADLLAMGYDWMINKKDNLVEFSSKIRDIIDLPLPSLFGDHQIINAGTAIAATIALDEFNISDNIIRKGITTAKWAGRMQRITSGKLTSMLPENWEIWIDGAHNEAGAQILSCIIDDLEKKPTYLICGFTKGRYSANFLSYLKGKADFVCGVLVDTETSAQDGETVAKGARECGFKAQGFDNIHQVFEFISNHCTTPGRVIFCGSLYLASDALYINSPNYSHLD